MEQNEKQALSDLIRQFRLKVLDLDMMQRLEPLSRGAQSDIFSMLNTTMRLAYMAECNYKAMVRDRERFRQIGLCLTKEKPEDIEGAVAHAQQGLGF